uniref:Nuclear receptor domain-containing protein n=1 Tax=Strongyloides stercoralis TaxID=6248 RepID=A0A0K0EBQ5_STRER
MQDNIPSMNNDRESEGAIYTIHRKVQRNTICPKRDKECKICGGTATGYHFGAQSCAACTAFFRRAIVHKRVFKCRFNGNCNVTIFVRNSCRACRMNKCLSCGMDPNAVQPHHDPIGKLPLRNEQVPVVTTDVPQFIDNSEVNYNIPMYQHNEIEYQGHYGQEVSISPSFSGQNNHGPSCCESHIPDAENIFENAIFFYNRQWEQRRLLNCNGTLVMFLNDIKGYENIEGADKEVLLKNIAIFAYFLERHFISFKKGGLEDQHLHFSDNTHYTSNSESDNLHEGGGHCEGPNFDNVKKILLVSVKETFNILLNAMKEINITSIEYIGVFLVSFFNPDLPGLTPATSHICRERRNQVFKEWMNFYHKQGNIDGVEKIGNMILLLSCVKESLNTVQSAFHMIRVFKIFEYDKVLEDLYL